MSKLSFRLVLLALLLGSSTLLGCLTYRGSGDDDDSGDDDSDDDDDDGVGQHGPDNTWFHAAADAVPAGLEGTGYLVGDTAYNFTLMDQYGDEVELYQFYGQVVLLDVFAEWCGPCVTHAPTGEEIWQDVQDRGVTILAMMQQNADGSPAETPEDAARWADRFDLTHAVLADPTGNANQFQVIGGGFPTYPLIGPDMTVIYQDVFPPSLDLLTSVLEDYGYW